MNANKVTKILSKRYNSRKRGYSRIIKSGFRYGDNAPLAIIELVDRDINARKVDKKVKNKDKKSETKTDNPKEVKKKEVKK